MKRMVKILQTQPGVMNETNRLAQTPLHLAVPWPEGVKVLLDHDTIIDSQDIKGYTPIRYAIELGFAESVVQLMKAGCRLNVSFAFPRDGLTDALTLACHAYLFPMWSVSRADAEQTLGAFVASLAERRVDLQNQVAASEVAKDSAALFHRGDRNIDEHTSRAEQAAKTYGLRPLRESSVLPGRRNDHLPSVYHAGFMTREIAERLWHAGFHDIDVPDENGWTPLMGQISPPFYKRMVECLEIESKLASWFVEKGANLDRPLSAKSKHKTNDASEVMDPFPKNKVLHEVASSLGEVAIDPQGHCRVYNVAWAEDILNSLSEDLKHFIASILPDPSPDSCACPCSSSGCVPAVIALKQLRKADQVQTRHRGSKFTCRPRCNLLRATDLLVNLLGPQNSMVDWVFSEVVRYCTFVELSLKHTCCRTAKWCCCPLIDSEEVDELQDEDSRGIELLEILMQEFEENRKGQDIPTFMNAYWAPRMNDILRKSVVMDKEKLREIGVDMHQDETLEASDDEVPQRMKCF